MQRVDYCLFNLLTFHITYVVNQISTQMVFPRKSSSESSTALDVFILLNEDSLQYSMQFKNHKNITEMIFYLLLKCWFLMKNSR